MVRSAVEPGLGRVKFSPAMIWLHWIVLILIVATYASIDLSDLFAKGSASRDFVKKLHFTLGLSVFALVAIRLLVRVGSQTPAILPKPPRWQEVMSTLTHILLYVFMIGMPLLGWLALSALGKPIPFFGLELPALIGPDKAFGKQLEHLHEFIGECGYYLIGLHAVAALFHHYVMKDNTLVRMSIK